MHKQIFVNVCVDVCVCFWSDPETHLRQTKVNKKTFFDFGCGKDTHRRTAREDCEVNLPQTLKQVRMHQETPSPVPLTHFDSRCWHRWSAVNCQLQPTAFTDLNNSGDFAWIRWCKGSGRCCGGGGAAAWHVLARSVAQNQHCAVEASQKCVWKPSCKSFWDRSRS